MLQTVQCNYHFYYQEPKLLASFLSLHWYCALVMYNGTVCIVRVYGSNGAVCVQLFVTVTHLS